MKLINLPLSVLDSTVSVQLAVCSSPNKRELARLARDLRFLGQAVGLPIGEEVCAILASYTHACPYALGVVSTRIRVRGRSGLPCIQLGARPVNIDRRLGFGEVHVVHEGQSAGVYLLKLRPGARIVPHCHQQTHEMEMVLTNGVYAQGRPAGEGSVFHWPKGFIHAYDNPTPRQQVILCVDRPRFELSDENQVHVAHTLKRVQIAEAIADDME